MNPPACIPGGQSPCPTCPVNTDCDWGLKLLIHDPRQLQKKIRRKKEKKKRKRRAALLIATIALLGLSCLPPNVDPPEPPVLTMQQRQKLLMEEFKLTGFMPHSGGYYVLVEEKP